MALDKVANHAFVHTWDDGVDHFYRPGLTLADSSTDEGYAAAPEYFDDYAAPGGGSLPAGWTQEENGSVDTNGGFIRFDRSTPGGFVVPNDGFVLADSNVSFDSNGDLQMANQRISGLPAPSADSDAATKAYADTFAAVPSLEGRYDGATGSVADGDSERIAWSFVEGDALLGLGSPATQPSFAEAGEYAISFAIETGDLTAGGYYNIRVDIERDGLSRYHGIVVPVAPATEGCFCVVLRIIGPASPIGSEQISVFIDNRDGASARTFTMTNAIVVKKP